MRKYAIILPICFLIALTAPALARTTGSAEADLDGDGVDETITIEYTDEVGDFTLRINDQEISGWLEPDLMGYEIVDINEGDDYVEVVVSTAGPSDDYESIIYAWQNGRIIEIDHITGYVRFSGDGAMLVDNWMGFWMRRDKCVLDPTTRRIQHVPQPFYYVQGWNTGEGDGADCTVLESFAIYSSFDTSLVLEELEVGGRIRILANYDGSSPETGMHSEWYLILSSTGLMGWGLVSDFWDKVEGLHWAD
jgi:hypothetical protein